MIRIRVTLSSGALGGLGALLAGEPVVLDEKPLLRFEPPGDWTPLDRALADLANYRAVAFTSPRAAEAFVERSSAPPPFAAEVAVLWAVGEVTAAVVRRRFPLVRTPNATSEEAGAAALAEAMLATGGCSPVLHPCGDHRREELASRLRRSGITVDEVVCYRATLASAEEATRALAGTDLLVVGSPRVARLLASLATPGPRPILLALGPTTARVSRDAGWVPDGFASRPSAKAVAEWVTAWIRRASVRR